MTEFSQEHQEEQQILSEIAQLSGLKPRDVSIVEIAILASSMGIGFSEHFLQDPNLQLTVVNLLSSISDIREYKLSLKRKYFPFLFKDIDGFNPKTFERKVAEIGQQFLQLAERLLDIEIDVYSYGIFFPSYQKMLTKAKNSGNIPHDSKTLLVGALTKDTASEYQQLMKQIFPSGQALTIDLEGIDTPKQGLFVYSNALRIAARSDTFNVIQTNVLLHQLIDEQSRTSRSTAEKRIRLFREFFRVLKPGGVITLVEGNLEVSYYGSNIFRAAQLMEIELQAAGFINIKIDFATHFIKSRSVLRSTSASSIDNEPAQTSQYTLQIYAEKPKENS